jgi:hypothetical protein
MENPNDKIIGHAFCTIHSLQMEKSDLTTFPTIYFNPIAGKIPNKRIVPGFIASAQCLLPDVGDYHLMQYKANKYFDEVGIQIDWISIGRLTKAELEQVKQEFGEPGIFFIEDPIINTITQQDCVRQCNFPRCSEPGCIRLEKLRFQKQYEFFRNRVG